jgi:hypothetical protein
MRATSERYAKDAIQALIRHYERNAVVLYTGAGVSTATTFGLPPWLGLLKQIFEQCNGSRSFYNCLSDDPWIAADYVIQACGTKERFQKELSSLVQAKRNYAPAKRQLSKAFLTEAATLNAVAAFCARLRGQVNNVKGIRYDIGPNYRVRAVLTSNYDPFLEASFSTKFIKPLLKPVAAFGSHAGGLNQIPVFHVHGYVPHPAQKRRELTKPLVSQLVLSREDYEAAWDRHNAFGTTITPQIHFIRHYTILFIGFSFSDVYVCNLLRETRHEYEGTKRSERRQHFALVSRELLSRRGVESFESMGIKPIVYNDHREIPHLLGQIYVSGLNTDTGSDQVSLPMVQKFTHDKLSKTFTVLTGSDYWAALVECRNGGLPASYKKRQTANASRFSAVLR